MLFSYLPAFQNVTRIVRIPCRATASSDVEISGVHSTDDEIAEDTAVAKAIRCIETTTNMVKNDMCYSRLKQLEELHHCVKLQLEQGEGKTKFARGWLLDVRYMHLFSQQIQNIIGS